MGNCVVHFLPAGIQVAIGGDSAVDFLDAGTGKGVLVNNDGYGSQDRLFSIEIINATDKDDFVRVKNADLSDYA